MQLASHLGHIEIVQLLLEAKSDKDKASSHGVTALVMASRSGHLGVVRLLLKAQGCHIKTH